MNKIFQKGYDAEILAFDILEKNGYDIIYAPEKEKRERQMNSEKFEGVEIGKLMDKISEKFLKAREGYSPNQWDSIEKIKKIKDEFYKVDAIHHRFLEEKGKIRSFIIKKIGKSTMPEINRKLWIKNSEDQRDSEDPNTDYYIEGFYQHEIDMLKSGKSPFELTYVDIFCKKGKEYYVFDIKHKTFKENKNLNSFNVTNYEVLNYNRIQEQEKPKVKILIILDNNGKYSYRIFDWGDFIYSKNYDPHKTPKTSIRLKNGFDISKLIKFN